MSNSDVEQFARKAEEIYTRRLQRSLEAKHRDEFVAIEPDSGDYFLGMTLSQALTAARRAHPDKLAHAMRIGHKAALHCGNYLGTF
jgi:hypothetical protein